MTLIDLSHPIADGTITYPGLPGPVISDYLSRRDSRSHYADGTDFQIGRIEMVSNTGTYVDTPFHRYADGHDLAGLTLERIANLEGVCVHVTEPEITAQSLDGLEIAGKAVLFATGWDAHWETEQYGNHAHPHIIEDAAEALVARGAALVGIDSVNIDDTRTGSRPAHSLLLDAEIPIVEHLTGLHTLPDAGFRFFAVPPRVKGMGTFPVRAFALIPDA